MSTIHDLRETLGREAATVVDTEVAHRAGAVHGRVRAVRRRRQGMAAAGALAAVAIGAAALVPLRDGSTPPAPATSDRTLGEHLAPETLTSLGYDYAFETGASDRSIASLHLDASDEPRLVTWAAAEDGVKLAQERPGERDVVWTSTGTEFDDFTLVPPGAEATYTAYADDVALAVYALDDEGLTFREQVGDATALGSVVGNPGEAEVSLETPPAGELLQVSYVCARGEGGYTHLSLNGEEMVFGPGCADSTFDPGGQGGFTFDADPEVPVELRLWVTDGRGGDLLVDEDVQLAVGLYAVDGDAEVIAGNRVPLLREHDGHLWKLSGASETSPGLTEISAPTPNGVPTLVALSWSRTGNAAVQPLLDGRPVEALFASGSGGTTIGEGLLTSGVEVGARIEGDAPDARLGLALYRRVD